ncbi:hypothetical protein IV203_011713 [Nitzschia inconspicua]|uniref:Transmembrane protein n=1 Tax=Nitzschia inconspicua TaxID=303405 RepID=A0A9K3KT09_9STRA|nr:hypothetical protein IV203_011713 [Nitzschia inconspicua]
MAIQLPPQQNDGAAPRHDIQQQPLLESHNDNNTQNRSLFLHPGNVLLLTSIPFLTGAFLGYRIPIERIEELASSSSSPSPPSPGNKPLSPLSDITSTKASHPATSTSMTDSPSSFVRSSSGIGSSVALHRPSGEEMSADEVRALASRMALRAFRIATLGTVAAFSLVGAVGFHISGYETIDDAVHGTRAWASSWSHSLHEYFGTTERIRKSRPDPDISATNGMTEDEQLQYLYNNYIAEDDASNKHHENEPTKANNKPLGTSND